MCAQKIVWDPEDWDAGAIIVLRVTFMVTVKVNSKLKYVVFDCGEIDGKCLSRFA